MVAVPSFLPEWPGIQSASTEQPRSFERHSNSNKQKPGNSGLANTSCLPVSLSHSILALLLTDQLLRLHFLDHPPSHKTLFCPQNCRRISCSEQGKIGIKVLKVFQTLFLFIFVCGIYVCTRLCGVCVSMSSVFLPCFALHLLRQSLSQTWSSRIYPDWLSCELRGYPCLFLTLQRWGYRYRPPPSTSVWFLDI